MYSFVTVGQITSFLLNYNINFLTLSAYEQAVIIILSNIFFLLFIIFALAFVYKVFCRILRIFC